MSVLEVITETYHTKLDIYIFDTSVRTCFNSIPIAKNKTLIEKNNTYVSFECTGIFVSHR